MVLGRGRGPLSGECNQNGAHSGRRQRLIHMREQPAEGERGCVRGRRVVRELCVPQGSHRARPVACGSKQQRKVRCSAGGC